MAGELAQLLWTEKYRPKTLDEVVNQSDVVSRLKVFVKEKNMPHLLFTGPPGVGKTTVALALVHDLYGEGYRRYVLEMNASVSRETPILVRISGSPAMPRFSDLDEIYFSRGSTIKIGGSEYAGARDLEVLTIDGASGRVRWSRARWIIRHRVSHIARIRLDTGGSIELTGNHSVMAIDSYGGLVERKASDLKVGGHLLTFTSMPRIYSYITAAAGLGVYGSRPNDPYGEIYTGPGPLIGILKHSQKAIEPSPGLGFIDRDPQWRGITVGLDPCSRGLVAGGGSSRDSDPLPLEPLKMFAEALSSSTRDRVSKMLGEAYISGEAVSRKTYHEILGSVDPFELSEKGRRLYWRLLWLANSDLRVVRIDSIEVMRYDGYVYDLSVPGGEMFFAGDTPVLLHNSDERGIDVIRTKVKEFARSAVVGEIPFKVIILDEADNMTADAQQALRRLMEMYVSTTRFILMANYSSKIIEPIQSRCAVFRFGPLAREDVVQRLKMISEREGVQYNPDALDAIYDITEGDMRRAINILQAAAALGRVTTASVYKVVGLAHPKEIREMIQLALAGNFTEARERLRKIMIDYGLSGLDVIRQIHREIFDPEVKIEEDLRIYIADYAGEINYRLIEGADDEIQLNAFLARLVLLGKRLGPQKK